MAENASMVCVRLLFGCDTLNAHQELLAGLQVQSMPACSNEHALMCRQALTEITARVLARKK